MKTPCKWSPYSLYRNLRQIAKKLKLGALNQHSIISYSQEGEDLLLQRHITDPEVGFYVEVGALDPKRFSNTYLFYKWGWSGILIEPNPSVGAAFRRQRPRDTFVNEGVSSDRQELLYHLFEEPALNTFDEETAKGRISSGWPKKGEMLIKTRPLKDILEQHMPADARFKLLSIDVEGLDELVCRSNDWEKFRPEWLIVEIFDQEIDTLSANPLAAYLIQNGYRASAKTGLSVIFRDTRR